MPARGAASARNRARPGGRVRGNRGSANRRRGRRPRGLGGGGNPPPAGCRFPGGGRHTAGVRVVGAGQWVVGRGGPLPDDHVDVMDVMCRTPGWAWVRSGESSHQKSTKPDRITDADHDSLALAAAFGPAPDADVHAAALTGAARTRWLASVALGGQGRYAAAATTLRPLINGRDQVLAALAGATLASHRRQLGGHAAARRLDAAALARLAALGTPPPLDPTSGATPDPYDTDLGGAWSDVLLGLTADAIGMGQLSQARRLHAAARALIDEGRVGGWRARVRTGWVATEIELASGRPEAGRADAEHAARLARAAGARRHIVKSDLVLGTTFAAGGTPEGATRAHGLLESVLSDSLRWGIFSLAWPAALVLADLAPDRREHFAKIASKALTWSFERSDGAMQRLATASPWVPGALVRSGEPTRTGAG